MLPRAIQTAVRCFLAHRVRRGRPDFVQRHRRESGCVIHVGARWDGQSRHTRPRLRFWTSQTISIDIAPGIIVAGSGAPGFSGHAGVSFADYAGLTMHVVALRPEQFDVDRSTRVAVFAGGRLASVPGTVVGVGGPAAVLAAFLIVCGSGDCFGN